MGASTKIHSTLVSLRDSHRKTLVQRTRRLAILDDVPELLSFPASKFEEFLPGYRAARESLIEERECLNELIKFIDTIESRVDGLDIS